MKLSELSDKILGELGSILHRVDEEDTEKLVAGILSSNRIFIAGIGRSGLITRPFAMRLMQMGLQVHLVGAVTTPSIGGGDLLIAVSGSGETEITHHIVSSAKNSGARVFLLTARSVSRIASISDLVIILPNTSQPILPLGSAFEDATFIFLDAIIILLMEKTGVTQQEMMKRHSNLE